MVQIIDDFLNSISEEITARENNEFFKVTEGEETDSRGKTKTVSSLLIGRSNKICFLQVTRTIVINVMLLQT